MSLFLRKFSLVVAEVTMCTTLFIYVLMGGGESLPPAVLLIFVAFFSSPLLLQVKSLKEDLQKGKYYLSLWIFIVTV